MLKACANGKAAAGFLTEENAENAKALNIHWMSGVGCLLVLAFLAAPK
jgi:hypothetical protein